MPHHSPLQEPGAEGTSSLSSFASYSVFLFFALMLSTPRAYALGAVLLLACSLYYLLSRPGIRLEREDSVLTALLALVFLAGAISWLYHGNPLSMLDLPSRYLLAIPIFLLLRAHPVQPAWMSAGLVLGGVTAGAVAVWEQYSQGATRVDGFTGGIQFGDLALMMAIFCAAALAGGDRLFRRAGLWRPALLVGVLCGSYASVMSGARGGWVAIPFVILVFCTAYLRRSNLKWAVAVLLGMVVAGAAAVSTVPIIKERFVLAIEDVQMYRQGDTASSLGARFEVWRALSVIIPQKPYMGWSNAAYDAEKRRMVDSGEFGSAVTDLANTHNTFLEVWVHQGLLGLVPLVALLLAALAFFGQRLRAADPVMQYLAVCGVSLAGCFIIFGQTQIMLGRNNTLLFFIISLVTLWGGLRARMGRHQ